MIPRLLRRLFTAETMGLILVVVSLQTSTYGVSSSLRGTDTTYLFWVCLIAASLALILNKSKWSSIPASVVLIVIGSVGVWILGARLLLPLGDLIRSISMLFSQIVPAVTEQIPVDTSGIVDAWAVIVQASTALSMRWQTWFIGLNRNVNVNDALIRNMIWTLLMWLIAAWAGWYTEKRNAILALLPQVIMLAIVISYSEYRVETIWLMVFVMLLLLGVWNYRNHTIQWERRRVDYSDSIRYDNTQAVLLLAFSVGVIAFITPSISWRDLRDYWREKNDSSKAAEMLGIQEQKGPVQNTYVQKPELPREHLLTEGFAQSQEIVMFIRTGELPPIPESSLTNPVPRYYWRSTVFDEYTGAGWITSPAPSQSYKANTPLIPGLLDGYRPLHLDVNIQQPEGKLFYSGILYSADIPFRADWRVKPQSSLFADQTALLQADIFAAATGAESYGVDVYVPDITVEDLQSATGDYPEAVRDLYLQLPRNLPDRVTRLAEEIAQGIETPYEKAKAIESYLRTNYPYDLNVPAPPEDQDVADHFLFDLKRGYCDYYATAMVVLARANGLPARFVSGYASGVYDAPNARYVVRGLNAHSWVEIYFPEIGWIEFEPTGSQPEIERPEEELDVALTDEPVTPASRILFQFTHGTLAYWLLPIAMIILSVILYYSFLERMIFMKLSPARAIEILYRRYYRLGHPFLNSHTQADTANEFTFKLTRALKEFHEDAEAKIEPVYLDAEQFTELYTSILFSEHAIGRNDTRHALNIWKRLRRFLMKEKILSILLRRNKK